MQNQAWLLRASAYGGVCIYLCKGFYLKFHCTYTVLQNNMLKSPTPC